jgi:hypothetical protein
MNARMLRLCVAMVALTLFSASAPAQSLRCKTDLVSPGDSRASVLQKCGEPVIKDSFCKPVQPQTQPAVAPGSTVVNVVPCENVDEWTYNPGYGQFMTTLRFEAGQLVSIKYGDRVK